MKKYNILIIAVIVAAASLCFAQSRAVDKHGATMAEGRPFITDGGLYNNYDLNNSPLGLFDIDSSRFSAEVGYGYLGLRDFAKHGLNVPTVRIGEPGRTLFEAFYGPDFLFREGTAGNGGGEGVSLPLQRFGLTFATQIAGGFFGAALSLGGYIGTQTWENGDSSRFLWGFDRIRVDMRSQVHPLVRIGAFANAALRVDTLFVPVPPAPNWRRHEDYSAQVNLPELGGSVDFGGEEMPVRSNLSISYASSAFAYRTNGVYGGIPQEDGGGRAPAIANDSFHLFWMAQGRLPINDGYTVKPGLLFGFSTNSGKMREPSEDNYPINLGDVINTANGSAYDLTTLYFGLGSGFELLKYADLHIEYVNTSLSLNCTPEPAVKSRALHHTAFGVSTKLHEYIDMPLKVTPRLAYFISGESGIAGSRWSDMEPLNIYSGKSKSYLYSPQFFLDGFTRISGFTFGVDGSVLEEMLSVSLWMTFLSSENGSDSKGGMELGLSAKFSI